MGRQTPFYVPMGSTHLYRAYATYFLGRPPNSQQELDAMELRIKGSLTYSWESTGYNKSHFSQQCLFEGHLFRAYCWITGGSNGTRLDIIRNQIRE